MFHFYKHTSFLLLLFTLTLFLRWNSLSAPFERDEGEYAYSAFALDQGKTLYQDAFIQKPPAIVYSYYLIYKLFGTKEIYYRLFALLFVFISAVFIYLIQIKQQNEIIAFCSALCFIFLISMPVPFLWSGAANTELFMTAPLCGALWVVYSDFKLSKKIILFCLFGLLALLYKPICLLALVIIFIHLFITAKKEEKRDVKKILFPLVPSTLLCLLIVWVLFSTSNVRQFYEAVVQFNMQYSQLFDWKTTLYGNSKYFWKITPIILTISILSLSNLKKTNFLWILLLTSILSIAGAQIPRYFIFIFPMLALLFGETLAYFQTYLLKTKPGFIIKSIPIIITLIVLYISIYPYQKNLFLSGVDYSKTMYPRDDFDQTKQLAIMMKEKVSKLDLVYIAGSEPQLYFYLQKLSPTRFITKYPLMLNTNYALSYQQEEIALLKAEEPDWIIFCKNPETWLANEVSPKLYFNELQTLIDAHYKPYSKHPFTNYIILRKKYLDL